MGSGQVAAMRGLLYLPRTIKISWILHCSDQVVWTCTSTSYCTPSGFRILASNYLGIKTHSMFIEIKKLITEVEVTPAEIAKELMKSDYADINLKGLLK